jgi:hypothetical protein
MAEQSCRATLYLVQQQKCFVGDHGSPTIIYIAGDLYMQHEY